jgi:hypothetical protein
MQADLDRADHNRLTSMQVTTAFQTAGLNSIASPQAIAEVLSSQFEATATSFAGVPFSAEPASFAAMLIRERA